MGLASPGGFALPVEAWLDFVRQIRVRAHLQLDISIAVIRSCHGAGSRPPPGTPPGSLKPPTGPLRLETLDVLVSLSNLIG